MRFMKVNLLGYKVGCRSTFVYVCVCVCVERERDYLYKLAYEIMKAKKTPRSVVCKPRKPVV